MLAGTKIFNLCLSDPPPYLATFVTVMLAIMPSVSGCFAFCVEFHQAPHWDVLSIHISALTSVWDGGLLTGRAPPLIKNPHPFIHSRLFKIIKWVLKCYLYLYV